MAKRRLNRYWTKNEKEVMRKLGLNPVPGSGSGELHKEDGENDYILCQLKSTEAASISINKLDIEKLLYHSELDNKIPVFAIQFLNGPILLATVPEELGNISQYLNRGLFERKQVEVINIPIQKRKKKIKASEKSIDEIIQDAKEDINEDIQEDNTFVIPSLQKRKENKIKQKEKSKWQK